jgi:PTH1 family peptidyl-tRNA hydrolase
MVKPLTYMNLSGQVLRPYLRRPAWSASADLMVVVDEVAIPVGTYRLRARGSAGGHNGLKDVERALGSQEYPRLRIGIKPEDPRRVGNLSDFVLSRFSGDERSVVLDLMPRFQDAIEIWLRDGILKAMNAHNGDAK